MRIVIDIDGVVADTSHRVHLIPDWDAFFYFMDKDKPIQVGIELIQSILLEAHTVHWVTGRPERFRSKTVDWLEKHIYNIEPLDKEHPILFMRKDGDIRPNCEAKVEQIVALNPELVIDDDYTVVLELSKQNIPTMFFIANPELYRITRKLESQAWAKQSEEGK